MKISKECLEVQQEYLEVQQEYLVAAADHLLHSNSESKKSVLTGLPLGDTGLKTTNGGVNHDHNIAHFKKKITAQSDWEVPISNHVLDKGHHQ
jgi:hypothetical protein